MAGGAPRGAGNYSPTGQLLGAVVRFEAEREAALRACSYAPTGSRYGPVHRAVAAMFAAAPRRGLAVQRQIEYYFGDRNYPKDKFLQKHARKRKGYVAIAVVLDFPKMATLTDSRLLVARVLARSAVVEVSPCGQYLRKRRAAAGGGKNGAAPPNDSWMRTVVVEGVASAKLPAFVRAEYDRVGTVLAVRDIDPGKLPRDLAACRTAQTKRTHAALTGARPFVAVEYQTPDEAVAAVVAQHNPSDWRSGVKVTLLWHRPLPKKVQAQKQQAIKDQWANTQSAPDTAPVKPLAVTRPRLQLLKAGAARSAPSVLRRAPLGPDGSAGFGLGRGKPLVGKEEGS